jgi:hypothetical protein
VVTIFMGMGLVAVMMTDSNTTARTELRERSRTIARYLAEGAVESAKKELVIAIANFKYPPFEGEATINDRNVGYAVTPTGFNEIVTDASGIQTIVSGYSIRSTAEYGSIRETSTQIVNVEATPIFQFAVFYTNDLEINPGPSMTLGGRVHTNADLYLGCGGTLTMDTNYVRSVGRMFRNRKDDPSASKGTVRIRRWVVNPYDGAEPSEYFDMNSRSQMDALGVVTVGGFDSQFVDGWDDNGDGDFYDSDDWLPWDLGALEYWSEPDFYVSGAGNTVKSAEHGVTEAVPPAIGSISMYEPTESGSGGDYDWNGASGEYVPVSPGTGAYDKGYYHENADLSIIAQTDGSWQAYDSGGVDVSGFLGGAVTVKDFYDARQSTSSDKIKVIEVDLGALNSSGVFPDNGLLYTASYGAGEGTDAKGVKLVNGSELAAPLTVVSENSMYVQGDYNTTNKVGASVIADAVNLLSNAWNDTKTLGTLPAASDTTFNLAFITGNHDTIGSDYNGGLENLPRFHENWGGKSCNIYGSFVNTWTSKYATGLWKYGGDRYKAPGRNWHYDTAFNQVANLPPFTPLAVTAEDVVSY